MVLRPIWKVIKPYYKSEADSGGHQKAGRAERSEFFIQPAPGSDIIWLSAVNKYIVDKDWADKDFIKNRVNGMEEYTKAVEPYIMEYAEKLTDGAKEDLITLAEVIHEAGSALQRFGPMGVTQHGGGSDTCTVISN